MNDSVKKKKLPISQKTEITCWKKTMNHVLDIVQHPSPVDPVEFDHHQSQMLSNNNMDAKEVLQICTNATKSFCQFVSSQLTSNSLN